MDAIRVSDTGLEMDCTDGVQKSTGAGKRGFGRDGRLGGGGSTYRGGAMTDAVARRPYDEHEREREWEAEEEESGQGRGFNVSW
jgi:hypothetical protein